MDERFVNPFAKVRRLHPDDPDDRVFILRYVRHLERDPIDADHLALGVCESIRDGDLTLTIEDDVVVMRTAQGDTVTVALADLRSGARDAAGPTNRRWTVDGPSTNVDADSLAGDRVRW